MDASSSAKGSSLPLTADGKQDAELSTKRNKKSKKKDRKRKYLSASEELGDELGTTKKKKSKHKKKCKKRHKQEKKDKSSNEKDTEIELNKDEEQSMIGPEIPDELKMPKTMAPMSKEEWEKQQNVIRRVYDEETGRSRLIKGDGEILEEIVSRERHKEINKQATAGDGDFFQSKIKSCL